VIEVPAQTVDHSIPYELERSTSNYRVIFTAKPAGETVAYVVVIDQGALISLELCCHTHTTDALLQRLSPVPVVVQQGPAFVAPPLQSEQTPLP
jgi:hypothetical protein